MRWVSIIVVMMALNAPVARAQTQKGHVRWFKVAGKVLDMNGRPIQWGRVYLKDIGGHFIRIKPISRDGHFDPIWLDAQLDYEIYAEQGDAVSEKVLVSGSQKAPEVVITLKLGRNDENH